MGIIYYIYNEEPLKSNPLKGTPKRNPNPPPAVLGVGTEAPNSGGRRPPNPAFLSFRGLGFLIAYYKAPLHGFFKGLGVYARFKLRV